MAVDGPPPGPPAGNENLTDEPSGGRRIGDYSIQRELGRGGMGAVYLAEHDVTHEKVALKELLIAAASDPTAVQRFLQEGALLSRLTHPNIVGVRGVIQAGPGHYIALELVEGGSLRDLLKGRPLPAPQAFAVMHGLLQALDHAHQHAIVHRDVKPENVMLSGRGEVKVTDFGIARLTDDSVVTRHGTTVGTPQYMSPEQVTTSKVDGRSDLYSAGVVCYELFCGQPPFVSTAADGPFTLFTKHVQAPPPPPSVIRPGLDPALEAVILKSLAKRPDDRYQTGAEFDGELSAIAARLCGPNWSDSLVPGADLTVMVPQLAPPAGAIPTGATIGLPQARSAVRSSPPDPGEALNSDDGKEPLRSSMTAQPQTNPPAWICRTCGVQQPPSATPPATCRICSDERQYVGPDGQAWTHVGQLRDAGQRYDMRELEAGLTGFRCEPQLGIGPVGYLVQTAAGNVLWDCPSFVDDNVVAEITSRGGLAAISASHPHFYGAMVDWSEAFPAASILLPAADREWVLRPDPRIRFWDRSAELATGLIAIRCGGHFEGSSVLHWPAGSEGRGVLFTGDTIMVAADRRWVSFMRSYPNMIPLSSTAVGAIAASVDPLRFDRIYGNPGWDKFIAEGAGEAVRRSAIRYRDAIGAG